MIHSERDSTFLRVERHKKFTRAVYRSDSGHKVALQLHNLTV